MRIIAKEKHEDGNTHIHAYIEFTKKLQIYKENHFDIQERHPNIQAARNIQATINYVKKEKNFKEYGFEDNKTEELNLFELAKSSKSEDFYETCRKRKIPFAYADHAWKKNASTLTLNSSEPPGKICKQLDKIKLEDIDQPHKSLIIVGDSGIGKTTWAKREAPKPALFVTHMDSLKLFDTNEHKSIIFDDMSFIHLPREAQIHLLDRDDVRSIHVRYGTATIPAGTVKIFTTNNPEIFLNDPAIIRRINKHLFA